jgi:flagellar hook-associated protein 1 FlgK
MSGLLATSLSGLMAAQRSLEAVQHNIANVNTEGYSRQTVRLATKPALYANFGYVGQGVNVTNVTRSYDQFINKQLSTSLSAFGDVDRFQQLATNVDNILADPSTGIAPVVKRFFNAVNEVASNPTSIPSRQVLLSEAGVLTDSFNTMSSRFEEIRTLNNNDIGTMVDNINFLATSIAALNVQISAELGKSQGVIKPNDLLDKQDALLSKLAEIVKVTALPQSDGSTSVFIGSGQVLVLNGGAAVFTTLPSPFDPTKLDVGIKTPNSTLDITSQISGGSLAGSLRFRDEVLDPAQQELGRVAVGLAMEVNALHKNGFDLSGIAGTDLFSFSGTVIPVTQDSLNVGNALVTAKYQDVNVNPAAAGNLDYSDFSLKYSGGVNYTLTRARDNQVINLTAGPTVPPVANVFALSFAAVQPANSTITALPGIDITVDLTAGAMSAVDQFVIRPTYSAAQKIGVNIDDPRKIAAATNIEVDPVTKLPVPKLDALGVPVLDALGNPVYVHINGPMPSDNRNALQLAELENKSSMLGGSASFSNAYGKIVSGVGTLTQAAGIISSAQETLLNQAKASRESLAGVNLDEEAASLIKFQQAYQASAQSISVAKSLFDTLIGAVR